MALVLLGAGQSNRFRQKGIPKKQWLRIGEIPLWLKVAKEIFSLYPFANFILTAHKNEIKYTQKYLDSFNLPFKVIQGGETRQESLQNALKEVQEEYVLVSDIARCNIPNAIFQNILEQIGKYDCVVPYLKVSDTLAYGEIPTYLNRDECKLIQTPQLSLSAKLKDSLNTDKNYTDESSAIAANGGKIGFIEGSRESQKITFFEDLKELNLPPPSKRTIIGSGSDIHQFQKGEGILLGGVFIPCPYEFIAHSDGDVCLHALCDAILGAIGAGDIGEWFPDNDESYKNANSANLLSRIVDFACNVGYSLKQADITIFAQTPKLSAYKIAIEKSIAQILNIPHFCVSLKATTTEKLGFIGRKEGVLTQANVVLEYFNWNTN